MPTATNRGVTVYYEAAGSGDSVVFIPDAGFGAWAWSWQAPALATGYEVIVANNRGTGRSDAPPGPYSIEEMANDLEAILADHGTHKPTLVGAGMGGMIALMYVLKHARATRLVVFGTPAHGDAMAVHTALDDPNGSLDALMSSEFITEYPGDVDQIVSWRQHEDADGEAARAHQAAVEAVDLRDRLVEITIPVLVAHGTADQIVPVNEGEALATALPRGRFETFEAGSHLFYIEQSRLVTDALTGFLESTGRA